ncbi:tRNA pseudouridine synthase Pus10 [Leguminivora glycinivorella]|uniref:tRNA pseudouridine synthase Pus10 n=1 Tax=Leguminivora glycinivorella TaxID=1035111 RepID=UPI00200C5CE4|nr:tRNA pseudouridine synthase Pus10 [Leguminivora glycinivorella]
MNEKAIFKLCKDEGCCDACALRYLGLHHPRVYENVKESAEKYQDEQDQKENNSTENSTNGESDNPEEPEAKRRRGAVCMSCLGLLQQSTWDDSCRLAKEILDKKGYDCTTFACALSAPIATIVREKYMQLTIKDKYPEYDMDRVTSLKEAWKWSFGTRLASHIGLTLDSGAVCPLLLTLHYEYPDDVQELEVLKSISPSSFAPHKRPAVDVTRRGAEQALDKATLPQLRLQAPAAAARAVACAAARAPLYIGGRYIKLSRHLPQTPWLVRGQRMMESSVQEIIFHPIADLYKLAPEEMEHRLKFVSAGREDVDVRCLGDGRPFAVEISDPRRELTKEELEKACEQISTSGSVVVKYMVHVTKDDLTELKRGEESKCKEYEALCIKLTHADDEQACPDAPVEVTAADIERINAYTNTGGSGDVGTNGTVDTDGTDGAVRIRIVQKTPLRVLHRRPLLARTRAILALKAHSVPDHPSLFRLTIRTTAGTYVKEWCHGELGRTAPSLRAALRARADILALDVASVLLPWPPRRAD